MKIGLFGGSFNPPHKAHLYISQKALRLLNLTRLFWLVVPQNPFKKKLPYIPQGKRIELCNKLIGHNSRIKAIDFESDLKTFESFNTVKKAKRVFFKSKIYFILGSDNLPDFHKWKRADFIAKNVKLVVFVRGNFHKDFRSSAFVKYKPRVIYGKKMDISSTRIRNELGKDWLSNWVKPSPKL